ncbi:MAG: pilus assembly protein PilM, partial [Planctomycetota bacterium]
MPSTGTGVVIGSHSLKVVQARKKGGVLKITKVANLKIGSATAERLLDSKKREHLTSLLIGAGVKPGEAMLGLTGRDLIIRYTHVPPVPDWRLAMLMKFEIEEVSEQSGGEVSADYARLDLPEAVSADNTVLVALSKNASLLPRMQVLKNAGLRIRGSCPNAIGFFRAFSGTAKVEAGEVTLLMHIGAENTDIAIQQDGKLLFARNVSGGGGLFTEAIMNQFNVQYDRAEKMKAQKADVAPKASARYPDSLAEKVSNTVIGVTGQFVSMVHSSIMFCKAQTKLKELNVDRVVLAGGGANMRGLPEYLETNLGIPVETYDPSGALDLSALPPEEAKAFEADPTGLTVALGFASMVIDRSGFGIEILPEEYRKRRRFVERDVFMLGAAAAAAILVIILFYASARDQGAALNESEILRTQEKRLNERITSFERAKKAYEAAQEKSEYLMQKIRLGPALQRALAAAESLIKEQGFKEIHIVHLQAGNETRGVAKEGAEDKDDPGERVSVVKVMMRAEIQTLGRKASDVYAEFIRALTADVQSRPGVSIKAEAPRKNRFQLTM